MESTHPCNFDSCKYPRHAKGWCRAHYAQSRRNRPMVPARPRSALERFMAKVATDPSTGCWIWTGSRTVHGYGSVSIHGDRMHAHRAAMKLLTEVEIAGFEVDHRCGVRACVNPAHLRRATRSENQQNLPELADTKSGFKNVNWHKPSGLWMVRVKIDGKDRVFGYYRDIDDAVVAAREARRQLHPSRRESVGV